MGISKSKSSTKPTTYAEPYITAAGRAQEPAYAAQLEAQKRVQPGLFKAFDFMGETLDGKFLNGGNPYLDRIVDSANNSARDRVNSEFMPRFGSAYHAKALAREIYENEARLRGGEYDRERGYQNEAAGNIAQLAGAATQLPGIPADQYAQNIGGLFGQYNKTRTTTPWGPALINGASNAAAAYFGGKR